MLSDTNDAIACFLQIPVSLPVVDPLLCLSISYGLSSSCFTDRTVMPITAINLNYHGTCLPPGYQDIWNIIKNTRMLFISYAKIIKQLLHCFLDLCAAESATRHHKATDHSI